MYGAILGDIIGSRFERKGKRIKTKDFELLTPDSKFTDDTVMTIAVADAVLKTFGEKHNGRDLSKYTEDALRYYGKKYPDAGYGGKFRKWLAAKNPRPYNSLGNGSAMRVSAVGWACDSMFDVRECARRTARPTHNHPEGVKGAMAVAAAIFMARKGSSKEEIKNYLQYEFDYNLSRDLDEVRENCVFDATCPVSVPEAIIAFLESENFVDAIRNAVSLGGDADTQAAIAGSIAEAFYGVPEDLVKKCRELLPENLLRIVDEFNLMRGWFEDDLENQPLENKIAEYKKTPTEKNLQFIKDEIFDMLKKSHATGNSRGGFFSVDELKRSADGKVIEGFPDYFEENSRDYDVLYTNTAEAIKRKKIVENSEISILEMKEVFRIFEEIYLDEESYGGLAINPYGKNPFLLDRDAMKEILDRFRNKSFAKKNFFPTEFTRNYLSNDFLTKKFFKDVKFIHTAASGAMGDPGVFEVWTKNFEHYRCHWADGFDVKKFHKAFMKDEDTPYFGEPVKNGWCFHYMGCGNNFYIKEELNDEYLKKFDEGLKNGKNYPHDEDVFPVEEIMLEILSE